MRESARCVATCVSVSRKIVAGRDDFYGARTACPRGGAPKKWADRLSALLWLRLCRSAKYAALAIAVHSKITLTGTLMKPKAFSVVDALKPVCQVFRP